tara:strand:+ start:835 stop:1074 length:240 start_codon:yes stop_codon:yes gene_type:complete
MHPSELSSLIVFHRKKAGLTQVALASLAGVSRFVVQDLEAGKGRTTLSNVNAVLDCLNIQLVAEGPLVDAWKNQEGNNG